MNNLAQSFKKRKIAWVTPDYFVDCDFNINILTEILKEFDIYWIVLLPLKDARFSVSDFAELQKLKGLEIEFMFSKYRQRSPKRIHYYCKIFQKIQICKPDITYLNCVPDPYLVPILWLFNKRKTILCAHDGGVNGGFDFKLITRISFNLSYRFFKYVCMFSHSQASIFHQIFPNVKTYIINLALKSFGEGLISKSNDKVIFLSFGVINYSKNIELLIEAACNIYEKGYRNFEVSINGSCMNWDFYQSYIRYPSIFRCNIKIINNSEIGDLFTSAHYFVQPYRYMSQSGAMKVAFNYNIPVIASNFQGFSEEIKDGINGYLFNPGDIEDLERLMIRLLENHHSSYSSLIDRMYNYTLQAYSPTLIAKKYLTMFKEIIDASNE